MLFLKVPRAEAEDTRRRLISEGLLSNEYDVLTEGGFVLFPVAGRFGHFEAVELERKKREPQAKKLRDELSGLLSDDELGSLTTSFDLVGDIAVVEIPEGLEHREKEIGEALLRVHKNVRTVMKKLGPMEGEFRVRRLACIAGEDKTETVYRESGVDMRLDLSKVYFSVRLAHERARIADMVREGEDVLVLFAGVGPFALVIAKKRPGSRITALEINPDAVRYLRENIYLNKMTNIEAVEGDAKTATLPRSAFDRIVMPLPKSAIRFLDVAFASVKDGGTVHLYALSDARDPFTAPLEAAREEAARSGVGIEPLSMRVVRPYSPSQVQVALDLRVRLNRPR